jgi:hypothetical protein
MFGVLPIEMLVVLWQVLLLQETQLQALLSRLARSQRVPP